MSNVTKRLGVVAAVLFIAAIPATAATVTDTFEQKWEVSPGGVLALSNENGSIEINSWDRSEVHVKARIKVRAGSRNAAEEAMKELRIETEQEGNAISIRTRKPEGSEGLFSWLAGRNLDLTVHYDVKVPRRFDVEAATVNGGIEAESLTGSHELETVNGKIVVRGSRGSVSADSVNGSIDVEIVEIGSDERMSFSTTNGGIELALPPSVAADLDAATTNGRVSSDIPLTTESLSRSRIRGTLGQGGMAIKIRTVNGSVRIHSSS